LRLPHEALVGVVRDGRILVLHRTDERYWHLVAGGLESGETAVGAAARELWEETGLRAEPRPQGWSFVHDEIRVDVFAVEAPAGWEPTLNEEHTEYRWAALDEALALLHWPEPRDLAAQLLS
jgi:8-oxo-dGTP pyrophosphatase MutT (NUDIX family)